MSSRTEPTLGYATQAGRGKSVNQDKLGFYRPDDARLAELAGSIYVVADGKGRSERGVELADLAIRQVVRSYYGAVRDYGRSDALAVAMLAADRSLREALAERPEEGESGVALAAFAVASDELIVGHVGAARAYLVRGGQAYRLTDDEADGASLVGQGPTPRPVISDGIPLGSGDRILLCTDGLYRHLEDEAIGAAVVEDPPGEASEKLVAMARAAGGMDDATALVVSPFEDEARPAPLPAAPAAEINWPTVAIGAGTLITLAALFLFRGALIDAVSDVRARGEEEAPTQSAMMVNTEAPATEVPATDAPEPTEAPPTSEPSPTVSPTATRPATVKVPSLIGLSREDAEQVLRANYLEVDLIRLYSLTVPRGEIISQDPKEGTELERESEVQISVSLGPAPPTATRFVPTTAPTDVVTPTAETPTQAPQPPPGDDDDDDDPKSTAPPPPPEPTKPDPPTPKPEPPPPTLDAAGAETDYGRPRQSSMQHQIPASEPEAEATDRVSKSVRGLAAPVRQAITDRGAYLPFASDSLNGLDGEDWQDRLNYHRGFAGALAVNAQAEWSAEAETLAKELVENDSLNRVEGSVLFLDAEMTRDAVSIIDAWMSRPFEGVQLLKPALTVAGFGMHAEDVGTFKLGAALDVARGVQPVLPPGIDFPLRYPSDGQQSAINLVNQGSGAEPNPLSACAGYGSETGPAILLVMGPQGAAPRVSASELGTGPNELEHCILTETTYTNADPELQARGRALLAADHAVVMIPRNPLRFGRTYAVSLNVNDQSIRWSFRANPDNAPTPDPVFPPATNTPTPTNTPTDTPTPTPSDTPTPTNTPTDTPTNTPTASNTPTITPSPTPAPAYLPLLLKNRWIMCLEPWVTIDDPEPDNRTEGLCPDLPYLGRLYLPDGTDTDDWFAIDLRHAGAIRIDLAVPRSGEGDYDIFFYKEPRGDYDVASQNGPGKDERIDMAELPAGRYWLRIWALGDQVSTEYAPMADALIW